MSESMRDQIRSWLTEGKHLGATHVLIVCDEYDHSDFPVYVHPGEDPAEICEVWGQKQLHKVVEVYNLGLDLESQLSEARSFHL